MEIEIEKMWHFTTTSVPVLVRVLGRIKKRTEKHIHKIHGISGYYEIQKITELLISLREYYKYD